MSFMSNGRARRWFAALLALSLLSFSMNALADTVTLPAVAWSSGRDGGSSAYPVVDGQFDALLGGNILYVRRNQGTSIQTEYRALYEFVLPYELTLPGVIINQATFVVPQTSQTIPGYTTLTGYGYLADNTITVDDFETTNAVTQMGLYSGLSNPFLYFNIPYWMQSLPGNGHNRIGLVFGTDAWGTQLQWKNTATLEIDYTPAPAGAPSLTVLSPNDGAEYLSGSSIPLQATANDPQEGNLDWNIQWTSSLGSPLGYGGNLSVQLPVGTHVITARVTDQDGHQVTVSRTVTVKTVVNTAPSVSILSPSNGAVLTVGGASMLQGTASDPEQGDLSANIQWVLDNSTTLGTGAVIYPTFSIGNHTITAVVTDAGGLTSQTTVNVSVVGTPGYCAASGSNTSMEWIGGVAMNGGGMSSGSNGGYANYTSAPPIQVTQGPNTIVLTPGFAYSSYTEYWGVWIDLNRDQVFTANELVFSGSSGAGALTGTLNVPTTAATGPTRMRVVMQYGGTPSACGTFSYGEVEDYTVNVVAGPGQPPTSPAYCSSRGQSTNFEYIMSTNVAGVYTASGSNGGYADLTQNAPIPLTRGLNAFGFQAGYPGGVAYAEAWMVWIDFNHDGTFSSDEAAYGQDANSLLGITVPNSALNGNTRMRISMNRGGRAAPCETFMYGEVEDYTVQIQ